MSNNSPVQTRRLRNHYYAIAYMSVAGHKVPEISKNVGLSEPHIRKLLDRADIKELCQKIHWQMFGKDIKKRFEHILPKAIDINEKIMKDETVKASIRKDIASDFIDRAMGKAPQNINVQTSSIRELLVTIRQSDQKTRLDTIEQRAKNQSIDASYTEVKDVTESAENIGEVEKWIKDNIGETT